MIERRKHKRYTMPHGTLAILRSKLEKLRDHANMQIGEIAMVLYKSEASVIGRVSEISFGGLSFNTALASVPEQSDDELDLLLTEQGIYLHNVPYVDLSTRCGAADSSVSLRFGQLDSTHKGQIRELLAHRVS